MIFGARTPPQLAQRFLARPALAIGARAGDGVVGVGDVHDPCEQRNLVAAQTLRIAEAVWPLVMEFDDRNVRLQEGMVLGMRAPRPGCCMMISNSSSVSRPGLRSTSSGTDLADVVKGAPRGAVPRSRRREGAAHVPLPLTARLRVRVAGRVCGSRASSVAASARMAPAYAASVRDSASATDAINWLKVSVNMSSSRLEPVVGSGVVRIARGSPLIDGRTQVFDRPRQGDAPAERFLPAPAPLR